MKYVNLFFVMLIVATVSCNNEKKQEAQATPAIMDSTLKLPEGFSASVFADTLGSARHIAFNSNGDIFVRLGGMKNGMGIIRLRDTNNDGVADSIPGLAISVVQVSQLKTGIYMLLLIMMFIVINLGRMDTPDTASVEKIISGLVNKGEHSAKAITLDDAGNIYVNVGAPSNSCQVDDRKKGSPGMKPCPILGLCRWHLAI